MKKTINMRVTSPYWWLMYCNLLKSPSNGKIKRIKDKDLNFYFKPTYSIFNFKIKGKKRKIATFSTEEDVDKFYKLIQATIKLDQTLKNDVISKLKELTFR